MVPAGAHEPIGGAVAAGDNAPRGLDNATAHEMRSHLTTILGYGDLLEMQDLTPAQKEAAAAIVKAGRVLLKMLQDNSEDPARAE